MGDCSMFRIDDLVVLNKDEKKHIYRITQIEQSSGDNIYLLVGYSYRTIVKVLPSDIRLATSEEIRKEDMLNEKKLERIKRIRSTRDKRTVLFGRILHIDGDTKFLESCLKLYKEMNVFAQGIHLTERSVKEKIVQYITEVTPDIIVVTGHDSYNQQGKADLNNYENSRNFIDTVRLIRKHYGMDEVVVIAGACASHFEALIASGANFASSPGRISTHTYDPAIVAIKVATTGFNRIVDFESIVKYIENGRAAIGGVETYGKMRLLL
jgi:spore coat assembly protein